MFLIKTAVLRSQILSGKCTFLVCFGGGGLFTVDLNGRAVLNTVGKRLSLTEHMDDGGGDKQL